MFNNIKKIKQLKKENEIACIHLKYFQDLANESIAEIKRLTEENKKIQEHCLDQFHKIRIAEGNCEILGLILTNTIKNEDGEETCTVKFKDIKSFATYIKAMNDINIEYLK